MSKPKPGYTGYCGQARWQIAAQYIGFGVILAVSVCMDGVMDAWGMGGFALVCGGGLALAGALIWAGNLRLKKKKAAFGGGSSKSGRAERPNHAPLL